MQRPSRRQFLGIAALGLTGIGALLAPRWLKGLIGTALPADLAEFQARLPTPPHARLIAREYLQAHPHEADPKALRQVFAEGALLEGLAGQPLRARLTEVIAQDYALERTQPIRGWIISRTEARLCVLAQM